MEVNYSNGSDPLVFMLNNSKDSCIKNGLAKFSEDFQYPQGIITLIIAIIGIVFNILNIVVLSNHKMRSPVNLLLMFLSVAEIGLLTLYIPYVIIFNLTAPADVPQYVTPNQAKAKYFLFYINASVFLHISATWLIITTAFFRFLLVQFPILGVKWCTHKRAIVAGVGTFAASAVITLPNMIRNTVGKVTEYDCFDLDPNITYYTIHPSQHFQSKAMELFNHWLFVTVGKFIPSILLLIFTIFLVKVLREANFRRKRLHKSSHPLNNSITSHTGSHSTNHRKSTSGSGGEYGQTTRMLLAVVAMFFIVEFSHGVILLWAGATENMIVYNELGEVIDLLTLAAFSINFVLYCTMSRQYRTLFIALIAKPFKFNFDDYDNVQLKNSSQRRGSYSRTHTEHVSMVHSELHPLNGRQTPHYQGARSSVSSSNNTLMVDNGNVAHV